MVLLANEKVNCNVFFWGIANLFGGLIFLQGCSAEDIDGCGDLQKLHLNKVDHDVFFIERVGNAELSLSSLETKQVHFDSLAIEMVFSGATIVENKRAALVNTAYACSPLPRAAFLKQVQIISDRDYDPAHGAGEDLSELFRFSFGYSTERVSFDEIIENEHLYYGDPFVLTITSAPEEVASHVLTFEFTNIDGIVVATTLDELLITN